MTLDYQASGREKEVRCSIAGHRNRGMWQYAALKSTLLSNLLLRFYCKPDGTSLFDMVHIFSSSILNGDSSTAALRRRFADTIYTDPSTAEQDLQRIIDYQKSFPVDPQTGQSDRPSIALVFDDVVPWGLHRNSLLFTIASCYRHFGCDFVCWLTQKYLMMPPLVRNCVSHVWLHPTGNHKEAEAQALELYVHRYPGGIKGFHEMMRKATAESKYAFLNLTLHEPVPIARRNFTDVLWQGPETTTVLHRGGPLGSQPHAE